MVLLVLQDGVKPQNISSVRNSLKEVRRPSHVLERFRISVDISDQIPKLRVLSAISIASGVSYRCFKK